MSHGSEKRARSKVLTVRLTPEEHLAIDAASERAGLTAASYARATLLGAPAPRQVRRPPVEKERLARLLAECGKIGSNINQIAKMLNGGREADLHALDDGLAALMEVRDAVLDALGRSP